MAERPEGYNPITIPLVDGNGHATRTDTYVDTAFARQLATRYQMTYAMSRMQGETADGFVKLFSGDDTVSASAVATTIGRTSRETGKKEGLVEGIGEFMDSLGLTDMRLRIEEEVDSIFTENQDLPATPAVE